MKKTAQMQALHKKEVGQLTTALTTEKEAHLARVEELRTEAKEQAEEAENKRRSELEAAAAEALRARTSLEKELTVQKEAELRFAQEKHDSETAALVASHRKAMQEMADEAAQAAAAHRAAAEELEASWSGRYDSETLRLQEEHTETLQAAISQMRAAHTAESRQKDAAHDEQATALRKQLLESTEKELRGLKEEHAAALGDLSQTRSSLQQSQSDHEETTKRMAEERAASEESLATAHRESTETLASSHAAEVEALQAAAATEKVAAEERYEDLSATFADLKCRFDARESREEDLARIAELEETVIQKEGEVAATVGQMGQMKAELNNRETSFNKTFANGGERPVVAQQDQIMNWMLKSKNKNKENKKKGPGPPRRSSVMSSTAPTDLPPSFLLFPHLDSTVHN